MANRRRNKKIKIASPVKSQKGIEVKYRKELNRFGIAMVAAIRKDVLSYLKANQSSFVSDSLADISDSDLKVLTKMIYDDVIDLNKSLKDSRIKLRDSKTHVIDGIGDQLGVIFKKLNATFTGNAVASFSQSAASQMVEAVGKTNKSRFDKTVNRATGVDLGSVIQAEGLEDFIALQVNKNVSLIESLPQEYLKSVETIVNNGVASGARYATIEKQIIAKTGSANSTLAGRIKTIARNEIQTINSQITLRRSEALGITKGIYRTSEDEKVRPCHAELNGDEFEIAKGAWSTKCQKFIQPGITDINCRCSYSPVIEIENI